MECPYNPSNLSRKHIIKYKDWLQTPAYLNSGEIEVTMEEAMTDFFYRGITPWMRAAGYSWSTLDSEIHRKFMNFAFAICSTLASSNTATLQVPFPNHRDLPEDRDTFDMFVDMSSFTDFLSKWKFRDEIIGTRLDFLVREFCYTWINVECGKPGIWTEKSLDMNNDENSDDERGYILPDGNWSRRKHDLY